MSTAGVAVTVNGVAAPLFYVAPGQLNIQIPYDTASGAATVTVNNNGQIASQTINVAAIAPGIFIDQNNAPVPNGTATRGQIVTLYITGAGVVSPAVPTGAAPAASTALADLPRAAQNVTVSVGGVPATVQFAGITPGLVGAMQINYQVPSGVATGTQNVIVSVGGVASTAASLRITN
jgi:uncharacterized protein (TIGR03437 family)